MEDGSHVVLAVENTKKVSAQLPSLKVKNCPDRGVNEQKHAIYLAVDNAVRSKGKQQARASKGVTLPLHLTAATT